MVQGWRTDKSLESGYSLFCLFLETLADSQLRAKGLARGREGSSQERATILAGMRRQLSMAAARAYSACLLDKVSRVGRDIDRLPGGENGSTT